MSRWNAGGRLKTQQAIDMKRTILAITLGMATSVTSTHGQGSIFFNNYGATTDAKVTIDDPGFPEHGQPAVNGFTARLLSGFGTITDPSQLTWSGITQAFNPATPGYFQGPIVTIPGYFGGPITFRIFVERPAGTGAGFAYSGWSELFTLPSIATGTQPVGEFGPGFKPFTVIYIPEPSTIGLVGLGLMSLLVYRWRNS